MTFNFKFDIMVLKNLKNSILHFYFLANSYSPTIQLISPIHIAETPTDPFTAKSLSISLKKNHKLYSPLHYLNTGNPVNQSFFFLLTRKLDQLCNNQYLSSFTSE